MLQQSGNPQSNYRILVVDNDEHLLFTLSSILENAGHEVLCESQARDVVDVARKFQPHLIVMDVILEGGDGIEICYELRQIPTLQRTLIAFYTARAEDYSQIAAFGAGADDYIIKPLKPNLLLLRIRALLKRHRFAEQSIASIAGPIRIDRERYLVMRDNNEIVLARKEFELLALLLASPRKVFTRQEIYREIWGGDFGDKNRTIDVHIRKLREKVGDRYIKTVKGIGYSFEVA